MSLNSSDDGSDDRPVCPHSKSTTSMSTGYNDSPEFGALAASLAQRFVPLTAGIVQLNRRISCPNGERGDDEDGDVLVWRHTQLSMRLRQA